MSEEGRARVRLRTRTRSECPDPTLLTHRVPKGRRNGTVPLLMRDSIDRSVTFQGSSDASKAGVIKSGNCPPHSAKSFANSRRREGDRHRFWPQAPFAGILQIIRVTAPSRPEAHQNRASPVPSSLRDSTGEERRIRGLASGALARPPALIPGYCCFVPAGLQEEANNLPMQS